MGRRRYNVPVQCEDGGCDKRSFYECETKREATDLAKRLAIRPWRCQRHRNPEEVLTPNNRRIEVYLTSGKSDVAEGMYWNGRSGFTFGKGWKAWAGDFPAGTVVRVVAEVLLPDAENGSPKRSAHENAPEVQSEALPETTDTVTDSGAKGGIRTRTD